MGAAVDAAKVRPNNTFAASIAPTGCRRETAGLTLQRWSPGGNANGRAEERN
jgi:hypothetical protein